jgi:crossover junction endodeoxyribonuclease RusA
MGGIQDGDFANDRPEAVTFKVLGMASAPQGSKRHVGKGRMIESSANVLPWRLLVARAAIDNAIKMHRGPVEVSAVFMFNRPSGHFKKDGSLKGTAPTHHCVKPDIDKLQRSTFDGLADLAYENDSRICGVVAKKRYCVGDERPGAIITIIPLSP